MHAKWQDAGERAHFQADPDDSWRGACGYPADGARGNSQTAQARPERHPGRIRLGD